MEFLQFVIDVFVRLDQHLEAVVNTYGAWTYPLLFVIIFCETGLVFTPFLPGDSLIFLAGALAARGALNPWLMFVLLAAAAIIGDTVNYWIGKYCGQWILHTRRPLVRRLVRQEHLDKTHAFFEKYGGKTIIIARFVPFVRTFAPFVAGLGAMTYGKFLAYNVIGGLMWVVICLVAGYFFGQHPWVKEHFSLVILAIILISVLPVIWGYISARLSAASAKRDSAA